MTVDFTKERPNRDYWKLLSSLNTAMLEKLLMNKHKDGFENPEIDYVIKRAKEEMDELLAAETPEEIRSEAADVANFCAMVVLKCEQTDTSTS